MGELAAALDALADEAHAIRDAEDLSRSGESSGKRETSTKDLFGTAENRYIRALYRAISDE